MQRYDRQTAEFFKVPPLLLMEQAALAAVQELEKIIEKEKKVLIVCGTGNNGGDGLAIARILHIKGYSVEIVVVGDYTKATEQNKIQQDILAAYGIGILKEIPIEKNYGTVIDGILGVGLTRNVEGSYKEAIEAMNVITALKVALDIPSGISADNGAILGAAFKADMTITFAFDKIGLHLWPGNEYTGRIIVKEIGITEKSFLGQIPKVCAYEDADLDQLTIRPSHANKGTFGKVLIIAGSVNMAGAAILAGKSAYASGCGLVQILTPEENRIVIQTALPEAILNTYDTKDIDTAKIKKAIDWADAILCGPGIGMSAGAERLVKMVLESALVPVVFDADALNILAKDISVLKEAHAKLVVTPHLGEMSRLTGKEIPKIQMHLLENAEEFAKEYGLICVLKDERTVTATYDGKIYLNLSGNSGMATAGSGDVLAGMISSLLAQGLDASFAASIAAYLHGAAGDKMRLKTGKAGLMASDIIEGIRLVMACKECKDGIL